MIEKGIDVDIETGRPKEEVKRRKKEEKNKKEEEQFQKLKGLVDELKSSSGSTLVDYIRDELEKRIDILISEDPEAKAYIAVLQRLGDAVNHAKRIAVRRTKEFKRKLNDAP